MRGVPFSLRRPQRFTGMSQQPTEMEQHDQQQAGH